MTHDDLHKRLDNWARWAIEKPHYQHCRSIEHRYKTPQTWEAQAPRMEADWKDAVIVERAIIILPPASKIIIVGHHLYRSDPRAISRRAGVNWNGFNNHLRYAESMLHNILMRGIKAKI